MSGHILALDQGTTGSTAVVLSSDARILGRATKEFPQHFPEAGWVEHEPDEIWTSILDALAEAYRQAGVGPEACRGIGITNQRETTLIWDRATGASLARAIVWQDRRTSDRCRELSEASHEPLIRERTGLVIDPYFSGTKIEWLLRHVPGARARAERGDLCFGTIDSYLVHRLTAGALHVTDVTNASRTMLFDIQRRAWDDDLLALLHVPRAILPEVRTCSEVYGHTKGVLGLPDGIPVAGIAGDQQAALFGQNCFEVGDAKCTYGTGAFLLMNTGREPVRSQHGLITTVAWQLGNEMTYALEGSAFIAGAAVQWLRDGLGLIGSAHEVEELARQVPSSGDVVFVPALAGLGAPHWEPRARGLVSGLTRDTTRAHLARATLEGIAFQIADLADAMSRDSNRPVARLRVDGGASSNGLLMQFQADIMDVPVDRPESIETTALGAGYLAGLAVGLFPSLSSVVAAHRVERTFEPGLVLDDRKKHREKWRRAVERAKSEL